MGDRIIIDVTKKRDRDSFESPKDVVQELSSALSAPRPSLSGEKQSPHVKQKKPSSMIERVEAIEPEEVVMARQLITRIGDYTAMEQEDINENIVQLANVIVTVGDINTFPDEISDVFLKCFKQLSVQTSILSTLLALIHQQNSVFSSIVVSKLNLQLVQSLAEDNVFEAKLILRTLACLTSCNCVSIESLCCVLSSLTEIATSPLNEAASDIASYLLAFTMPWCTSILATLPLGNTIIADAIDICTRVSKNRTSPYDVGGKKAVFHVHVVPADEDGNPTDRITLSSGPEESVCWDILWDVCTVALDILQSPHTFRPPACIVMPWIKLKDELSGNTQSQLSIPGTIRADIIELHRLSRIGACELYSRSYGNSIWLLPRFAILDQDSSIDSATLCTHLSQLEKFVAVSYYQDILHFFAPITRDDGTRMGSMELLCNHLVAVDKLFPDFKMENIMFETLFQMTCCIPVNRVANALCYRVISDLCKKNPLYPVTMALCAHLLYQQIAELDTSIVRELSRWLSFHLNNSQLIWPYWTYWAQELKTASPGDASRSFLQMVVEKCARLGLPEKVRTALPKDMHHLIPADCCVPKSQYFTKNGHVTPANSVLSNVAANLRSFIQGSDTKPSGDSVFDWLEALDVDVPDVKEWRIRILLHTIFSISSTILSNLTSLLDLYIDPIQAYTDSDEGSKAAIETIEEVFRHDYGMLTYTLDEMIRKGLLSIGGLISWISSPTMISSLASSIWSYGLAEEVVDRALDIMRATSSHRRELGGVLDLNITTNELSRRIAENKLKANEVEITATNADRVVADNVDNYVVVGSREHHDIDDDGDNRGSRNEDDGRTVMNQQQAFDYDNSEDPLLIATIAVMEALKNCRLLYSSLVTNIIVALIKHEVSITSDSADEIDPWSVAAKSLLKRILRSYAAVTSQFRDRNEEVVLTDIDLVETNILALKQSNSITIVTDAEKILKMFIVNDI